MASLCRMCGGKAEPIVSLLDTSHHHLQWAINHFHIDLDDVLPTSVCSQCDNIILEWTLFLSKREKARTLFSTMIANQPAQLASKVPHSSVPSTKKLQHPRVPRQILPRPHTSNTSVPSKPSTSGHFTASAPDLSLPQHLVTEYHIKDFSIIMSKLSDQVLDLLQQNGTVDCKVVDTQMSEQRNERIKLEPGTVDPCVCNDQVSDNLQQNLSSSEDDDDIEVPFEAIYDPLVKCGKDLVQSEPSSDLLANQSENHLADNVAVTVVQGKIGNAEEYSEVQPDLPKLNTSPETNNPSSNKDVNINISVFNCAHCNFTTNCKSKIKSHIVKQHIRMSNYQCQECSKSYKYRRSLQRHTKHAHPNKCSYKCPLCKRGFQLENYLNAHIKNHEKLQCDVCAKIFGSKRALTEHKLKIHIKSSSLSCDMCSKIFYTDKSLKDHTRQVHSNFSFQCDVCDKSFKLNSNLQAHQKAVHSSVRAFSCNQCEKTFVTKTKLKQHSDVHSNLRSFKCDKCGSSFNIHDHLKRHIHTVHSNVRAFKCHLCAKSFKSKSGFGTHLMRHTDVHSYICEQCGKQFKTKAELNQHLTSHSEIRPFACDQCDKKFKTKESLIIHLGNVHSDLRPFSCDKCSYACKTKYNLNKHKLSHSNVRNFECNHCKSKFKYRYDLRVHFRTKHLSSLY